MANLYPSERAPGFGPFVSAHVEALRAAGQHVDVVAITDPNVHRDRVRKYVSLSLRATLQASTARVQRRTYDVVEAHIAFPTGLVALPAKRIGHSELVLFAHGSDVARIAPRSRFSRALARRTIENADLVVANSAFSRANVLALGKPVREVEVVSPGITFPDEIDWEAPRAGVLFVGRLSPEKGLSELIGAVGLMRSPKPVLTVVGDGPSRAHFEALATRAGLPATFVGAVPPDAVGPWYSRSKVVVMPSVVAEGLGLVALEAMGHGALVIGTRVGGLPEIIDDGVTGFLVEPGDQEALASRINLALQFGDSTDGRRMRSAARRYAETHALHRTTLRVLELYEQLLQEQTQ